MGVILLIGCGASVCLGLYMLLGATGKQERFSFGSGEMQKACIAFLNTYGARVAFLEKLELSRAGSVAAEICRLANERGCLLTYAGASLAAFVLVVLSAFAGCVVALSWIGCFAGATAACLGLVIWSQAQERRRLADISSQVPALYRSLASALGSGRTLSQAISYVASLGTGPLEQEFNRASLRILCGTSAIHALQDLPQRIDVSGINLMVSALSISARTGAPLQGLFSRAARLVERRFELERELKAKTAQVRMSVRLVSALPVVMVVLLALLSPDYREGLSSASGSTCLAVAVVLDAIALLIIRHLMKGVI